MNTETVARVVAALQKHHGLLTVTSANQEGINKMTLLRAAESGVVLRHGRNRYADPALPPRKAVLLGGYVGEEAVLSFEGAQWFHRLDGIGGMKLVWSVPHGSRAELPNFIQRRKYAKLEVVERDGVRVTSVRQTLLDLGARIDLDSLECAYESALRKDFVDDIETRDWLKAHAGWHGAPALRAVMGRREPGERPTGSEPETRALQLYRAARIGTKRQWRVVTDDGITYFGDFGFPPKRCITEIEGLEAHDLANRQYDYDRKGQLEDMGYLVRPFTVEDVKYRGFYVVQRTLRAIEMARPL